MKRNVINGLLLLPLRIVLAPPTPQQSSTPAPPSRHPQIHPITSALLHKFKVALIITNPGTSLSPLCTAFGIFLGFLQTIHPLSIANPWALGFLTSPSDHTPYINLTATESGSLTYIGICDRQYCHA